MNKRLALLLAMSMLATLILAGCGNKEEAGSAEAENSEETFVVGFDAACPPYGYKDANGKTLSEWYKNRNLADEVIKELTSRGATVIYTTGDAREAIAAKSVGKPNLLISLHCDAAETSKASGLKMMYASGEKDSFKLAIAFDKEFSNKYNNNCNVITDKDSSHRYIGILHGDNGYDVPAVLCEMGFMSNRTDIKNIDSSNQRKLAADCIGNACEAYLKQ